MCGVMPRTAAMPLRMDSMSTLGDDSSPPPPQGRPDPAEAPSFDAPPAPPAGSAPAGPSPAAPPPPGAGGYQQAPPPHGGPGGGDRYFLNVMGQDHGPYTVTDLAGMAVNGQLKGDTPVRVDGQQNWFPANQVPGLFSHREWLVTLLLSIFVGTWGIDRMYVGQVGLGILKLVTCGGLWIWYIIDIVLIVTRKMVDAEGRPLR